MEPSSVLSPPPQGQAQGLLWCQLTWCFPGCAATLGPSAEEGQCPQLFLSKVCPLPQGPGDGTRASGRQPREVAGAAPCSSLPACRAQGGGCPARGLQKLGSRAGEEPPRWKEQCWRPGQGLESRQECGIGPAGLSQPVSLPQGPQLS